MPNIQSSVHARPIMGVIRSAPMVPHAEPHVPPRALPFITISRMAGAGGWTLARQLADAMNQPARSRETATNTDQLVVPWTCWDRQVVEKVAAENRLPADMIETLDTVPQSWLNDFLRSLSFSDDSPHADEARIYGRVAAAMRTLARTGHVILVGHGGAFITRRLPGGIHLRLVAPLHWRIAHMAKRLGVSEHEAADRVRELEHNREAFYRRYWPQESFEAESFTVTFNTAEIQQPAIVEMVKAVVKGT